MNEILIKNICLICNQKMEFGRTQDNRQYYSCYTNTTHHSFTYRIVRNTIITQLIFRINDVDGSPLFFRTLYDQDKSEVWTNTIGGKIINIDTAFTPNFSDLDKLKNKLKLYMILS